MRSSRCCHFPSNPQAANPGCLLDDFVRWYSPRDWIEGEDPPSPQPPLLGHERETKGLPTSGGQSPELSEDTRRECDDEGAESSDVEPRGEGVSALSARLAVQEAAGGEGEGEEGGEEGGGWGNEDWDLIVDDDSDDVAAADSAAIGREEGVAKRVSMTTVLCVWVSKLFDYLWLSGVWNIFFCPFLLLV